MLLEFIPCIKNVFNRLLNQHNSWLLEYINVNFNLIIKGHSRVVSEACLSNLSLDEDQMPHI